MVTSVVANKLLYVSFSLGAGLADDQFTPHIHVVIRYLFCASTNNGDPHIQRSLLEGGEEQMFAGQVCKPSPECIVTVCMNGALILGY